MSGKQTIVVRMVDGSIWHVYDDIEALAAAIIRAQAVSSASMLGLRVEDSRFWLNANHVVSIAPRELP